MRISGVGAMVGAAVGAVARTAVVFISVGGVVPLVFVLPSAAIGLLVGAIAGALARPWLGAILGFVLSAVIFELFMLPCASLIGVFGQLTGNEHAESKFLGQTLVYMLEMGVAGALAGLIGGLVGQWNDRQQSTDAPFKEPPSCPKP